MISHCACGRCEPVKFQLRRCPSQQQTEQAQPRRKHTAQTGVKTLWSSGLARARRGGARPSPPD
eukprot:3718194-Alexandrium_andersonii.AAC.1